MIYSLCDIAGKDRATNKPIISIRAMDMEMQLLRYFRDYGLDNDPDWRESLEVILESQREDGCFPLSSDRDMPSDARVDFLYRPTYACCQIMMRAYWVESCRTSRGNASKLPCLAALLFPAGAALMATVSKILSGSARTLPILAMRGLRK